MIIAKIEHDIQGNQEEKGKLVPINIFITPSIIFHHLIPI